MSLVSVVFPSMISSSFGYSSNLQELGLGLKIESFEISFIAIPLFVSNSIVIGLTFLYFKKKLPPSLENLFTKLFKFEISKKSALISIIIILGIYIALTAGELDDEELWLDYKRVNERISGWSIVQATDLSEPHVRYFLITSSMDIFGNYKVIPFLASIALLLVTYILTVEITKKKFAGIIALLIVLQSNIFLTYDTSVTYDNFWILFYLVSIYFIVRAWPLSPIFYIISIPAKALTAIFLPMSLFFIYRSNVERRKKIILLGTYVGIGIIGIIGITSFNEALPETQVMESNLGFWQGFASIAFQMRFDLIVTLFLFPLVIGLFIASRHGYKHADSVLVMIGVFLLTAPILTGFTNMTNQPYRFIPLVVFFAVGVGVLLSKINSTDE